MTCVASRIRPLVVFAFVTLACRRDAAPIGKDPTPVQTIGTTTTTSGTPSIQGPFSELVGVNPRYDAKQLLTAGKLVGDATEAGVDAGTD
jgi:hypothetical protein